MKSKDIPSVGVALVTFRARKHLPYVLPPLLSSSLKPKVLVVDSSSDDGTVELSKSLGAETHSIAKGQFNNGLTREKARHLLGTDIAVLMTQDAYAFPDMLEKLVEPIMLKKASLAYARQLPHKGAGFFEAFPRHFNYPDASHIRSIKDVKKYGVYTFFCSNSCAAYDSKALDSIGGFKEVLFGEDTIAAAELLKKGHSIAYVAEAKVNHSHHYTLWQEFQRHFDIGLMRRQYCDLLCCKEGDTNRGKLYVQRLLGDIISFRKNLLPYATMHILSKWMGYKLGWNSIYAPLIIKKTLSSQSYYWY